MGDVLSDERELQASLGDDRFVIDRALGRGGMGAVYLAYDRERNQRVALKTLLTPDATAIYRFKREFRALADVSHPNLVTLYDLVSSGGRWFFTMELVHGVDLLSYVRGSPRASGSDDEGSHEHSHERPARRRSPDPQRQEPLPDAPLESSAQWAATAGEPEAETGVVTAATEAAAGPSARHTTSELLTAATEAATGPSARHTTSELPTAATEAATGPSARRTTSELPTAAPTGGAASERRAGGLTGRAAKTVTSNRPLEGPSGKPTRNTAPADPDRLRSALLQLAEALHALHQTGHLHRDVKPTNVMVTDEGRVVVLDFGVITELSGRKRVSEDDVAGTPAYMAPEQLEAGADPTEATDWYGLGIILFEALTGQRPFLGGSNTVLLAKQTYSAPVHLLLDSDGPRDLLELCQSLLERDPAARPSGVEVIRRLRGGSQPPSDGPSTASRTAPSLRMGDGVLVGRERELEALRDAYRRARLGEGVGVLLHGRSGMGKSALVERFLDELESDPDAVLLTGRCYQQESVPYKALDSLVDSIARHLLGLPTALTVRLLPNDIGALARAFPVLGRVDAIARHMQHGGPEETDRAELQRRAFAALHSLLGKLAETAPLVLYIDDLQWGDVESAALLVQLLGPKGPPVLFIAGYRSEEVGSSPLLQALLEWLSSQEQSRVERLEVAPLPAEVLEHLASELLMGASDESGAASIATEANGSPYYVHEMARYVASQPSSREVREQMSLAAVILARADELSPEARRLLEVITVAGWKISVGVAQAAASLGEEERRAFVELRAGHYVRSTGTRENDTIEPYHDRVREAVVPTLSEARARAVHLSIAQALEEAHGDSTDHVYALANHYYRAAPEHRRERVFDLNLRAARTAATSYAFRQAHTYLTQARHVASEAELELDAKTELLFANVSTRIGRAAEGLESYSRALEKATDAHQRATILAGISRSHLGRLETGQARDHAHLALAELGEALPRNKIMAVIMTVVRLVRGLWVLRTATQSWMPAGPERERTRLLAQLHVTLGLTNYYHMATMRLLQSTVFMLLPAARLGPSRELIEWYTLAAGSAAAAHRRPLGFRLRARARALAKQTSDPVAVARSDLYTGMFTDMSGEPVDAYRGLAGAFRDHVAIFEPMDYYGSAAALAWNCMMAGRVEEGWAAIEQTLKQDALVGQLGAVEGHTYRCYAYPLLTMQGRTEEAREHHERFSHVVENDPTGRWRRAQHLAQTALFLSEAGEVGEELDEVVARIEAMQLNLKRLPFTMRHMYVAIARAHLIRFERADEEGRPLAARQLEKSLRLLRKCTARHPTLIGHQLTIEGRYDNLRGRTEQARARLADAERIARETDNAWISFEVVLERARFAMRNGSTETARDGLERALGMARDHRWKLREESCARLLAQLHGGGAAASPDVARTQNSA